MAGNPKFENHTRVFCLLGDARALRSQMPHMFTTVLKRVGLNGVYVPLRVKADHIGQAVHSLQILNMAGANITAPFKEAVIPHLDILSEGANIIGAVNTVVLRGEEKKGYNTNAIGFMDALGAIDFDVAGKKTLVFGTGGAARAVVFIFNWLRAGSILLAGRNADKGQQIVRRIGGEFVALDDLNGETLDAAIVVNATTVSEAKHGPNLAALLQSMKIANGQHVIDLNYGYADTMWQPWARQQNLQFMDGLATLAFQARRTFALWTGTQVKPEEFSRALNRNTP